MTLINNRKNNVKTRKFFPHDHKKVIKNLGKDALLKSLEKMLLIRNFEIRGEASYQMGKVGGFFHSYVGQEAIQTACLDVCGKNNYWVTTYRCHALALLLGATPNELMAELFGRETGNARGRGGSMHMYTERMLGGFGIVAEQVPVAVGAGFTIKYKDIKDQVSVCFLGDGAVAQGAFHESLNIASLWNLPCIFVIENNQWGMGTSVKRAICVDRLAEDIAPGYNMKGYTLDGMDYFNCYSGFKEIHSEVLKNRRPILVEAVTERFRGHSISDPGLYRKKEDVERIKQRDPIFLLKSELMANKFIDDIEFKEMEKRIVDKIKESVKFADASPWPDPVTLEEDVFAP